MVRENVGENSYGIEVKPGVVVVTTAKFLKPYTQETTSTKTVPLFYHHRTMGVDDGDVSDFIVDEVLGHKVEKGVLMFKTKWEGYGEDETTWEKIGQFVSGINVPWKKYCEKHGLKIDLVHDFDFERDK